MPPKRCQRGSGWDDEQHDVGAAPGGTRRGKNSQEGVGDRDAADANAAPGGTRRPGKKKGAGATRGDGAAGGGDVGSAGAAAAAAKGAGEDGAAAPGGVVPNPGGRGGRAASVVVGAASREGAGAGQPKFADFSTKKPKKGAAGDPSKQEDDPKEDAGTGTEAVDAGSLGQEIPGEKKLSRRVLKLQKLAEKSLRLKGNKFEEDKEPEFLVQEADVIDGNETKPKKVKKAKNTRRGALWVDDYTEVENKSTSLGEKEKGEEEALLLEEEKDDLEKELLQLKRDVDLDFPSSVSGARTNLEEEKDDLEKELLQLKRDVDLNFPSSVSGARTNLEDVAGNSAGLADDSPMYEDEPDERTKKQGRKSYLKGYLGDSEYGDKPAPLYQDALNEYSRWNVMMELYSIVKETHMMPAQKSIDDIRSIEIDENLEPDDLEDFYDESALFYLENYPLSVPVKLENGEVVNVSVTPKREPTIERRTHHIIAMIRKSDNARAEILVENYSGYAVACRAVYEKEDRKKVTWSLFGEEPLASPRFKWRWTKYGPSYNNIDQVYMGKGVGPKIFKFIESFRHKKQEASGDGKDVQHAGNEGGAAADERGADEETHKQAASGDGNCVQPVGKGGDAADETKPDKENHDVQHAANEGGAAADEREAGEETNEQAASDDGNHVQPAGKGGAAADETEADADETEADKENHDQGATVEGEKCLDTIYAVFCEGRRFWKLRRWAQRWGGKFPDLYSVIVRDWSSLGKGVQLLYLFLLESELARVDAGDGVMAELAEKSKAEAIQWWNTRQNALVDTEMQFYKEERIPTDPEDPEAYELVAPDIKQLAGTELTLIKIDEVLWEMISKRELGYNGRWLSDILPDSQD